MKIEIVEFYPFKTPDGYRIHNGTLHIYLIDWKIDLRGIKVQKINNQWRFYLPVGFGIDPETKQKVRYPILSFTDRDTQRRLVSIIRQMGQDYIMQNFKDLL